MNLFKRSKMANGNGGITFSWWQFITACFVLICIAFTVLKTSDIEQVKAIDAIEKELKTRMHKALAEHQRAIDKKLESAIFFNYKDEHAKQAQNHLRTVLGEFRKLEDKFNTSNLKIVTILTRMEKNQH